MSLDVCAERRRQLTVNQLQRNTVGSIPTASTKIWSYSISVSIMACHAVGTSSILVGTAKVLFPGSSVGSNGGLLIRMSQVRALPGEPYMHRSSIG